MPRTVFVSVVSAALLCLILALPDARLHAAAPTSEVDFDTQIRTLLSDKCFHCHGPDEATREAGLRLDTREGAFEDLGGYAAITPGDHGASEVLVRILSDDPDTVMPPPESKLKLSASEIKTLKDWIDQGANWSEHWSFVPPKRINPPKDDLGWSINEIDQFILAKAAEAGLKPSPPASREALVRRLSLDLTGLPPTLQEIDQFVTDDSDNAYEQLVDRLLASPHYGQRMAWEWLDAARYADTDGFQGDPTRTMWPWRDWLVNALNDNMPFDQFTIEMLAGDLLDSPTQEQILATGFNRNHMFNGEGGRIAEETRVENVFDRAETTATVWMGLTMTCCRCHDHKYDPISQKEYFQLYSFFDNTSETGRSGRGKTTPILNFLPESLIEQRERLKNQIKSVENQLAAPDPEWDAKQRDWETSQRQAFQSSFEGSDRSTQLHPWWKIGTIPAGGNEAFKKDFGPEKTVDLEQSVAGLKWKKTTKLKDGQVFPLPDTVGATYFYRKITAPSKRNIRLSFGSDDGIKVFLNGKEVLANLAYRAAAADQEIIDLELDEKENHLLVKVVNTGGIGGFYFKLQNESAFGLPLSVAVALAVDPDHRSNAQTIQLREHYRGRFWNEWKALKQQRKQLAQQLDAVEKQSVAVMVMDDLPRNKRRKTRVLERGGYDNPTDTVVTPNTPAVLPALAAFESENASRLDLANWIVDPANPLTARVTVNRYWQLFFGRGIVASTEDFGSQGSRPTHPALLDALAIRFVESGWNVKAMHKLMVMSATYRQSVAITDDAYAKDPKNRWLARAPRYRLPSWMLRDQALAAGGLLSPAIGGPSVKTYQPDGIWAEATFGKIKYKQDDGEKLYRRSLYLFWRRIVGPTMFFDGAKRQTCEVKSSITNTPLHALTTLNETTFVESARSMAGRVIRAAESDDKRIEHAFRLAVARSPNPKESEILTSRVDQLTKDFLKNPGEARELLSVGDSAPLLDEKITDEMLAQFAAYSIVCSTILNLDEALSRP